MKQLLSNHYFAGRHFGTTGFRRNLNKLCSVVFGWNFSINRFKLWLLRRQRDQKLTSCIKMRFYAKQFRRNSVISNCTPTTASTHSRKVSHFVVFFVDFCMVILISYRILRLIYCRLFIRSVYVNREAEFSA